MKMKSMKELENKIEFFIIETLDHFNQIKYIMEDETLKNGQKLDHIESQLSVWKKRLQNDFCISDNNSDFIDAGYLALSENLEQLKLLILQYVCRESNLNFAFTFDNDYNSNSSSILKELGV